MANNIANYVTAGALALGAAAYSADAEGVHMFSANFGNTVVNGDGNYTFNINNAVIDSADLIGSLCFTTPGLTVTNPSFGWAVGTSSNPSLDQCTYGLNSLFFFGNSSFSGQVSGLSTLDITGTFTTGNALDVPFTATTFGLAQGDLYTAPPVDPNPIPSPGPLGLLALPLLGLGVKKVSDAYSGHKDTN